MEKKRLALLGCGKLNNIVGSSKDAIAILPTKVNVSVATALASVGPEKLEYHINSVPVSEAGSGGGRL